MFIDEHTGTALKAFLLKTLAPISVAEPEVLATYVLALLKNDKPAEELRDLCVVQLEDFLRHETKPFVTKLFNFLSEAERAPKAAAQDSLQSSGSYPSIHQHHDDDDDDRDRKHSRSRRMSETSPGRKRRTDDSERDSKRHHGGDDDDRRRHDSSYERKYSERDAAPIDRYEGGRRTRGGRRYQQGRSNQVCRDYEDKGVCLRGDTCPYVHPDRIRVDESQLHNYVPTLQQYAQGSDAVNVQMGPMMEDMPYDPMVAGMGWQGRAMPMRRPMGMGLPMDSLNLLLPSATTNLLQLASMSDGIPATSVPLAGPGITPPSFVQQQQQSGPPFHHGRGRNREGGYGGYGGDRGDRGERSDRGDRSGGGAGRKVRNPNCSTLLIVNIPRELNSIDQLNTHFKKFGTVTNLQVFAKTNRANVQFARHTDALDALRSPEAVLGNRFIKVIWLEDESEQAAALESSNGAAPAPAPAPAKPANLSERWNKFEAKPAPTASPTPAATVSSTGSPLVASTRTVVVSPAGKRTVTSLQKEKEELRRKQLEQQKELLEMITKLPKDVDPKIKTDLLARFNSLAQSLETSLKKDTQRPALVGPATMSPVKRKLIARTASEEEPGAGRGFAGRGRGRGTVVRGRGRGRGGIVMTLDNRPTTILVSQIPAELQNEEQLLLHFRNFGEVAAHSFSGAEASFQYANRRVAELAIGRARTLAGHTLTLSWAPVPSVGVGSAASPARREGDEEVQEIVYQQEEGYEEESQSGDEENEGERSWKRH